MMSSVPFFSTHRRIPLLRRRLPPSAPAAPPRRLYAGRTASPPAATTRRWTAARGGPAPRAPEAAEKTPQSHATAATDDPETTRNSTRIICFAHHGVPPGNPEQHRAVKLGRVADVVVRFVHIDKHSPHILRTDGRAGTRGREVTRGGGGVTHGGKCARAHRRTQPGAAYFTKQQPSTEASVVTRSKLRPSLPLRTGDQSWFR